MRIVGLDVSRSVAEIAYLEDGTLHVGGRTGLRRDELERFAAKLRATDHVVLEATGNTTAIVNVLRAHVARVAIANPLQVRLIAEALQQSHLSGTLHSRPGRFATRAYCLPAFGTRTSCAAGQDATRGKHFVTPEVMISERPAEIADRAVPGHWEGDLIIGLNRSAIGTLVERTTRFTMLLHLPPMEGHGVGVRAKNGPTLAGHGAEAVRNAIATKVALLPENLRQSLTWDQGAEMAQHVQRRIDTALEIYL